MKKFFCIIFVLILTVSVFTAGVFFYIMHNITPVDSEFDRKELTVDIPSGMNARTASVLLYEKGMIRNKDVFYLLARFPELGHFIAGGRKVDFSVRHGVCRFSSSMDAIEIYQVLSEGNPELSKITVPEGLTLSKTAARFEAAGFCSSVDFMEVCRNKKILSKFGIDADSAEGYLYPDTYVFSSGEPAGYYVEKLIGTFFEKADSIKNLSAASAGRRREILTLASIIEREYRLPEEAPVIASVFENRIKSGMGLYSCATVEYVITEVLGRPHPDVITYADLKLDSPYNTYRNAGLPPGPICSPGMVALKAAADPADTDYYYFRITDSLKGAHVFSRTFQEHIDEGVVYNTKKQAGR